jgi:hypothetical protein
MPANSVDVVCTCGRESAVEVSGIDGAVEAPTLGKKLWCGLRAPPLSCEAELA